MRVRIPLSLFFKMKKGNKSVAPVLLLMAILAIVSLLIIVFYEVDILEGKPAVKFCTEKCEDYDLLYSVNDTQKEIIMCECIRGKTEPIGYTQHAGIDTIKIYFNSSTFEEIKKELF